jgi:hypothetical protein
MTVLSVSKCRTISDFGKVWNVSVGATVREGFSQNQSGLYLKRKPALTLGLRTPRSASIFFLLGDQNVNIGSNKKSLLRITTKFLLFCREAIIIFLTSQLLRSFFRFQDFQERNFSIHYSIFRQTIFVPEASLKGSLQ